MNKKKKVKVLIADDQTLFREGIKDVLTGEKWSEVVGEAADGLEVVALAKKLKPDVVLMDIKLPKQDGITATRQIRRTQPVEKKPIDRVHDRLITLRFVEGIQ